MKELVFAATRKAGSSSIILTHPPRGQATPSQADIVLTGKLKEGSKLLDLPILDHFNIAGEGYYFFADE